MNLLVQLELNHDLKYHFTIDALKLIILPKILNPASFILDLNILVFLYKSYLNWGLYKYN